MRAASADAITAGAPAPLKRKPETYIETPLASPETMYLSNSGPIFSVSFLIKICLCFYYYFFFLIQVFNNQSQVFTDDSDTK